MQTIQTHGIYTTEPAVIMARSRTTCEFYSLRVRKNMTLDV